MWPLVDVSKESGQEAAEMPMYRGTLRIERVELKELKDHSNIILLYSNLERFISINVGSLLIWAIGGTPPIE